MNITQGKGIVASDLHIGRPDTNGKEAIVEITRQVRFHKPSLIVLNGDVIEAKGFPGSREKNLEAIDDAVSRIHSLVQVAAEENPDATVVFVYGNHDSRYEVAERLAKIQEDFPNNFYTEEAIFRARDTLFTHGDLQINYDHLGSDVNILKAGLRGQLNIGNGQANARDHSENGHSSWKHVKDFGRGKALRLRVENRMIGAVDTWLSPIVFPVDQVTAAIHRTLVVHDEAAPEGSKLLDGVRNICIGHIHPRHNTTHEHEGITFRATGPATQFSKNTMYLFDVTPDALENFQTFQQSRTGWQQTVTAKFAPSSAQQR